ncbi:chaperonin 10-like protein [Aspergillus cavernicola]|uniref:Chaperonin 10-like protein n=1 Tax=Aspergillus cavernicola TaxID=176166 RepID=A0ABR4IF96_9EURO
MQALQAADRTLGLRLEKGPTPEVGPNDALIEVHIAGITPEGLQLLETDRAHKPSVVGHEVPGTIAKTGDLVPAELAIGSRIRVQRILFCLRCECCSSGREHMYGEGVVIGFAQFS